MVYEKPAVLASYSVSELVDEATVCMLYCPDDDQPGGPGGPS